MNSQVSAKLSSHDFMQPLNVIQLASGNIRARIMPLLAAREAEYLAGKLDRIEQQVVRLAGLAESVDGGPGLTASPE
jgi:hypothetical protein